MQPLLRSNGNNAPPPADVASFIRKNLLGPRETILAAFAAITCTLFSGYFSAIMGAVLSTIWLAPLNLKETKNKVCLTQRVAYAKYTTLAGAVTAMLLNIVLSGVLFLRVWSHMFEYWDVLSFSDDCNWLLSIKVLSYREVFAGLILGATSISDLCVSVSVASTMIFQLLCGSCKASCCLFVNRQAGGMACQCHKCGSCSLAGLCKESSSCCGPCNALCGAIGKLFNYIFCEMCCDVFSCKWVCTMGKSCCDVLSGIGSCLKYCCCCKWVCTLGKCCTYCCNCCMYCCNCCMYCWTNICCCIGVWIVKILVFGYLCVGGLAILTVVGVLIFIFSTVAFGASFVLHTVVSSRLGLFSMYVWYRVECVR